MKKPKIREIIEAIKALIKGPYTTEFPKKPCLPPDGFRGKPQFYQDDCVGCCACVEVCPARAIDSEDTNIDKTRGMRKLTHWQHKCIYCGQCEKACITQKGIKLTKDFDLASLGRIAGNSISEKELKICEFCGEIIAPMDHLKWLANKVGTLVFANPTLLSARLQDLELIEKTEAADVLHKRGYHNRMLCPKCRREVLFTEQW